MHLSDLVRSRQLNAFIIFNVAILIAIIGVALARDLCRARRDEMIELPGMPALLQALGNQRQLAARIYGASNYHPYITRLTAPSNPDSNLRDRANSTIINQADWSADGEYLAEKYIDGQYLAGVNGAVARVHRGAPASFELFVPPDALGVYLRGGNETERSVQERLGMLEVTADILLAAAEHPSPPTTHAAALVEVLNGELDEAIKRLESALALAPDNGVLLNDLAAVYLERGHARQQPRDLFHALSIIDHAINVTPTLVEAQFNRALILESLQLLPAAQVKWQEYLEIDRDSAWAQEARAHLDQLATPSRLTIWTHERERLAEAIINGDTITATQIINRFPHEARLYALHELLPDWADARADHRYYEAEQSLIIARLIGNALGEIQQDNLIRDLVGAVDKVVTAGENSAINAEINAHRSYRDGRVLIDKSETATAVLPIEQARVEFHKSGDSTGELCASFQRGRCHVANLRLAQAQADLQKITAIAKERGYPYLIGRLLYRNCLIQSEMSEFNRALIAGRAALVYFDAIGDREFSLKSHAMIANILNEMKDDQEIWSHQYEVLKALNNDTTAAGHLAKLPELAGLIEVANELTVLGEYNAARYLYQIALSSAQQQKFAAVIFTVYYWRSINYHKIGKLELARADLEQARSYLDSLQDATLRANVDERLAIVEAEAKLTTEPARAIELLSGLIDTFKRTGYRYQATEVYLLRARAYLRLQDFAHAEVDLNASIDEYEQERSQIADEDRRISFFEAPQLLYDEMIRFQIAQQQQVETAFEYAETARARALLDTVNGYGLNGDRELRDSSPRDQQLLLNNEQLLPGDERLLLSGAAKPYKLAEIRAALPKDSVILEYTLLSDRLFIWAVAHSGVKFVEVVCNADELARAIARYRDAIERKATIGELSQLSMPLYDALIRPIAAALPPEATIVVVPDKELHQLPFAALVERESGQFLIEAHAIINAPSASVFIHCLTRDERLSSEDNGSILAIGNPQFDRARYPKLPNLQTAEFEAERIAGLYRHASLLLREAATKPAFWADSENHSVIHFAGHALMNIVSPLNSKLLLAAQRKGRRDEDQDSLTAFEIYRHRFSHTRLVVLAACQTASGREIKGEGVANLARPFLASGVPAVIASLWNADDRATAKLFTIFHARRMSGESSIAALRAAQRALLQSDDDTLRSPALWASFMILGGAKPTEGK